MLMQACGGTQCQEDTLAVKTFGPELGKSVPLGLLDKVFPRIDWDSESLLRRLDVLGAVVCKGKKRSFSK